MDWHLLAPFLTAILLLLLTPDAVVAIVVNNTLRNGAAAGALTALSVELGEFIVFGAVFAGLVASQEFVPLVFHWLSLAGVAYLIWLAARIMLRRDPAPHQQTARASSRPVIDGLTIAFSNPTTFVFHTAFFPQFINPDQPLIAQLAILGTIYFASSLVFDFIFIVSAARLRASAFHNHGKFSRLAERGSAAIYIFIAAITIVEFANGTN